MSYYVKPEEKLYKTFVYQERELEVYSYHSGLYETHLFQVRENGVPVTHWTYDAVDLLVEFLNNFKV